MTGIDDTVNCKVNGQLILKSEKLLYVNKQQQKKPHKITLELLEHLNLRLKT